MPEPTPKDLPERVARLIAARAATARAKAAHEAAQQAEAAAHHALAEAVRTLDPGARGECTCYVDPATGTAARIDRRGELELFPVTIGGRTP
jgi:hypothetical protein